MFEIRHCDDHVQRVEAETEEAARKLAMLNRYGNKYIRFDLKLWTGRGLTVTEIKS